MEEYAIVITSSYLSAIVKELIQKNIDEIFYYDKQTCKINQIRTGINFSRNLEITKGIEGFLTEKEQLCLMFLPSPTEGVTGDIVEIGSYLGKSACCIAGGVKAFLNNESPIYCIDPFEGYLEKDVYFEDFKRNISTFSSDSDIKPLKGYSYVQYNNINLGIKLLFLDGNHTYENVKRDLELFLPKISIGGIIAMHDSDSEGVNQAVSECVKDKNFKKLFIVDSITVFKKIS